MWEKRARQIYAKHQQTWKYIIARRGSKRREKKWSVKKKIRRRRGWRLWVGGYDMSCVCTQNFHIVRYAHSLVASRLIFFCARHILTITTTYKEEGGKWHHEWVTDWERKTKDCFGIFLGDAIKLIKLIVIGDFLLSYLCRRYGLNKGNPPALMLCLRWARKICQVRMCDTIRNMLDYYQLMQDAVDYRFPYKLICNRNSWVRVRRNKNSLKCLTLSLSPYDDDDKI